MDTDSLVTFLATLEPDYETHEFCWGGIHPDGRRRMLYSTLPDILPQLVQRNDEGFGIFVCVNAITPAYEKGLPKRKAVQVNRVRAVFADWDKPNAPVPKLPIPYSMLVGTSPGKFHIYWLVDDLPLDQFERAQRGIAQALGSDASIIDLSREMRLPGFLHTKNLAKREEVKLLACPGHRYGADEILGAFPYDATAKTPKFSAWDGGVRSSARMTAAIVEHMYPRRADGAYNVPCPWASEHTTKGNASETTYFPPGELNDGKGMFKCFHQHCLARFAEDYDAWLHERVLGALGGK